MKQPASDMLTEAASLFALLGGVGRAHLIVVGGLVPPLLAPKHATSHVGSADVDFCLSVAITEGRTAHYKSIEEKIEPYFEPVASVPFRWRKKAAAPGFPLVVDFLAPDDESTPVADGTREIADATAASNLGLRLRPHPLRCGDLVDQDAMLTTLKGVELVYTPGRADIDIRHAGPVGFLAAKADALHSRGATPDGTKDGYDITWWCMHAAATPAQTAGLVIERDAFRHEKFAESVHQLDRGFAERDYPGPTGYAIEHTGLDVGDEEFERARNESFLAVSELIDELKGRLWS
jgi:hypothetical protein